MLPTCSVLSRQRLVLANNVASPERGRVFLDLANVCFTMVVASKWSRSCSKFRQFMERMTRLANVTCVDPALQGWLPSPRKVRFGIAKDKPVTSLSVNEK
jgi:hypothetical protein